MRVEPRPLIPIITWVVYLAVVLLIWKATAFDYSSFTGDTSTVVSGVVLPIGVGAVGLAAVTTWAGWWGPALREPRAWKPRWLLSVPIFFMLLVLTNLLVANATAVPSGYLLAAFVGTALVGFSEELLTRGLMVVGLRAKFAEPWVWLGSTLSFSLLHGINMFVGQDTSTTIQQMILTFLVGTALYVSRMATGTLIVPMVIHALWDLASFIGQYTDTSASVLGILSFPFYLVSLIGLIWLFKSVKAGRTSGVSGPSEASATA